MTIWALLGPTTTHELYVKVCSPLREQDMRRQGNLGNFANSVSQCLNIPRKSATILIPLLPLRPITREAMAVALPRP